MKIISDNSNDVVINNKYIEIHIKEKYIDNKSYIKKVCNRIKTRFNAKNGKQNKNILY